MLLNEGLLSQRVLGLYRRLSSAGLDLAGRAAAAAALMDENSQDSLRVLRWALEPTRPPEVNQAVLQAVAARPPGVAPPPELRRPLQRRLGDVPAPLLDDLGRALARYDRGRVEGDLLRLAERTETPQPLRNRAIAVLGERRTKAVAELLIRLSDPRRPGDVRSAAFASLATLSGIDSYGEDTRAWSAWWEQAKEFDADAWARSLFRNVERREAVAGVNTDQLVDRLLTLNTTLYRLAGAADKPRVLTDLLRDELEPLSDLGLTLAEQRLSAGEGFDEPLRAALRDNLDAVPPDTRRRAAALLRDLSDGPAADRVVAKLAAGNEHVTGVLRADLRLLARQPRVGAVEPAYGLLGDADARTRGRRGARRQRRGRPARRRPAAAGAPPRPPPARPRRGRPRRSAPGGGDAAGRPRLRPRLRPHPPLDRPPRPGGEARRRPGLGRRRSTAAGLGRAGRRPGDPPGRHHRDEPTRQRRGGAVGPGRAAARGPGRAGRVGAGAGGRGGADTRRARCPRWRRRCSA